MSRRSLVLLLVAASSVVLHAPARAQGAADLAAAEALFDEGKHSLEQGAYSEACAKLSASLRLDVGIGTMLYLAECYLRSGRTASAWGQFREAAAVAASRRDAREPLARDRAARLEPQLSRLVVMISASDIAGMVVRRDGEPIERAVWSTPVPVDPGDHVVEASAPGRKTFVGIVRVERDRSTLTVTVPPLDDAAPPESTGVVSPIVDPMPPKRFPMVSAPAWLPAREHAPASRASPIGAQRAGAFVVGGLGVAAVGFGSYWGLHARALLADSNADGHCQGDQCDLLGVRDRSNALAQAHLSTAAFSVGAVDLIAGAVLWLTASRATPKVTLVPALTPHGQALVFSGAF